MTKSWQIFETKLRDLKQHTQLVDLSLALSQKQCKSKIEEYCKIASALNAKPKSHLQLNLPNTPQEISRVFAFSRMKLNEQAIIELYRLFTDYISNIIAEIFKKDPNKLLGALTNKDEKSLYFHDIIRLGNYDAILEEMTKKIYRQFENTRSTPKLLDKIISITKINIPNEIKEEALLYLEIRHLIIHNYTKADSKFTKMNNANKVTINTSNNKISMNYQLANNATIAVFKLCKTIDDELITKNIIHKNSDRNLV